jgi:hypothetical protein
VAAAAHRVGARERAVASHPWVGRATRFCLDAIGAPDSTPHALEMIGSLWLLDAVHASQPEAAALLERLGRFLPTSGRLPVEGGLADEMVRPLDLAPTPESPVRSLFSPEAIAADLQRLVDEQQDDGGWRVDFANYSPAAALEWRGYMTFLAISLLRQNGLL